jgi:DNA-binding LytR/AlgR family response regulator
LRGGGFHVTGFVGPVLAWQVFQGLILYAAVAAVCYALARSESRLDAAESPGASRTLQRCLVREGDDFRPMDVSDIITITGAGDYSEVATARGRYLVRMSLSEFQGRLDSSRFIRVHRSTIIHLAHLERAEPAGGGRMLAHMMDGQRIAISRRGVSALRPLIV